MRKIFVVLGLICCLLLVGCGNSILKQDYDNAIMELNRYKAEYGELKENESYKDLYESQIQAMKKLETENQYYKEKCINIEEKYKSYMEKMKVYEGLDEAEAKAREIEANRIIAENQAAEEAKRQEELAKKEAEEKMGYETGITYGQLARTPDDFKGKKVKFTGKVIQVVEGRTDNQIRLAVDSDSNQIIYCDYKNNIVSSRILDNDKITIYGTSKGLKTYDSVLGQSITIPYVNIDKIDTLVQDSEEVAEEELTVDIIKEYTMEHYWGKNHFLVVKNTSDVTVDISISSIAYSKDEKILGASDASEEAIGPGCTTILYQSFDTESNIGYYENELEISKSKYYESVIQDLSYVQHDIDKGAVFQVKNNGEDAAQFVEGYALFFDNGKLVGYEWTYFTDDDSEIKPGKTISKELTIYDDFDTIEFYLTGHKNK